jgi:DNA-binding HxlR family transcriptional regulator
MTNRRIVQKRGRERSEHRSGCLTNLVLEVLGDKWSLVIIRDMIFGNRRHFRELLQKSEEGIASNILADRRVSLGQSEFSLDAFVSLTGST